MWATADTNLFATLPQAPGQTGFLLPVAMVTPANFAGICSTAPYNGPNCPQHNSSSGADVTNELVSQFLGQNVRSNTFEVRYDLTQRVNAYLGYAYTARTIEDFSATFDTGEIYFPGGPTGSPANDFLAARGDCALVSGKLPSACTLNSNGSVQEGSSTNLVAEVGNNTARNVYDIHENLGLFGVSTRPTDTLRLSADLMFGYNDNSFTRISPRQVQSYKINARYTPKPWANIAGALDIHENRDNVSTVNNVEHGRTYSFVATISPNANLWVDFGYTYMDIYTQTEICFPDTGSTVFTTPCPVPGASSPLGTLSALFKPGSLRIRRCNVEAPQACDRHAGIRGQHHSRQYHPSEPTNAYRHAGFRLHQAVRKSGVGHLQRALLQDGLELLQLQRSRRCQSNRFGAAPIAGFQREQCHIFVSLCVLNFSTRPNQDIFGNEWSVAHELLGISNRSVVVLWTCDRVRSELVRPSR